MPVPETPVQAVIFDWGGTLTPWHTVDLAGLWAEVCRQHFGREQAAEIVAAIHTAERDAWQLVESEHRSTTLDDILQRAGVSAAEVSEWTPA